jgi:FkbM family methyltransferase
LSSSLATKVRIASGAFAALPEIKRLLLRRHRQKRTRFPVEVDGVSVQFSLEDFYSNMWFHDQVAGGLYEPVTSRLLIAEARRATCILDAGANLGYFTVLAAAANPGASVHALEMDSTLAPIIRRNLEINGLNASVLFAAAGDRPGALQFTPHPFSFLARLAGIPTDPFDLKLSTPTVRIDDYFADKPVKPDFIKMDIDGGEAAALRGMPSVLSTPSLRMLIEIHPQQLRDFGSTAAEVVDMLRAEAFLLYRVADFRADRAGPPCPLQSAAELTSPTGEMCVATRTPLQG